MGDYLSQTALIVEDEGTSRKILRGILQTIGFMQIEEVESGEEALTKLHDHKIGLVLADWHMQGMSGLELLKHIKNDETRQHLKSPDGDGRKPTSEYLGSCPSRSGWLYYETVFESQHPTKDPRDLFQCPARGAGWTSLPSGEAQPDRAPDHRFDILTMWPDPL